jgi:hypothetical protein
MQLIIAVFFFAFQIIPILVMEDMDVKSWTTEKVCEWLKVNGLEDDKFTGWYIS